MPQKRAKSDCVATILDGIHMVALTGDEKAADIWPQEATECRNANRGIRQQPFPQIN